MRQLRCREIGTFLLCGCSAKLTDGDENRRYSFIALSQIVVGTTGLATIVFGVVWVGGILLW